MIFTSLNFILFFILLVINLAFILTSKRKRRFGIIPSRIFQILFIGYWFYLLTFLQFYNPQKAVESAIQKTNQHDYTVELNKQLEKEVLSNGHILILNYVIKASGIQAMIVSLLCIIGLMTINNRNEYYWKMLIIHTIAWGFCIYVDHSNLAI